jgi:hypothetical protein
LAETQRVQLGAGLLGVPHQMLVEHDAEIAGTLAHFVQRTKNRPRERAKARRGARAASAAETERADVREPQIL